MERRWPKERVFIVRWGWRKPEANQWPVKVVQIDCEIWMRLPNNNCTERQQSLYYKTWWLQTLGKVTGVYTYEWMTRETDTNRNFCTVNHSKLIGVVARTIRGRRVHGKILCKKEEPSWRLLKEERKIYLKKTKCLGEGQQSLRIRNSFQLLSPSLKMFIV